MKKSFTFKILSFILCFIIVFSSGIPVFADDEDSGEWDDEMKEEAWMAYTITNWGGADFHVSYDGVTEGKAALGSGGDYISALDYKYSNLTEEMIEEFEATNTTYLLRYDTITYKDIFVCFLAYENYICLHALGDFVYDYSEDSNGSTTFRDSSYLNGELNNGYKHKHWDVALVDIFVNPDFDLPNYMKNSDGTPKDEHEAYLYSLDYMFKKFVECEYDQTWIQGDILSVDHNLTTYLIKTVAPDYNHEYSCVSWQDHMADVLYNKTDDILAGKYYPWLVTLGIVEDVNSSPPSSEGSIAWEPMVFGDNYGDNPVEEDGRGDGIVDNYADFDYGQSGNDDQSTCAERDPSYFSALVNRNEYTAVKIEGIENWDKYEGGSGITDSYRTGQH